MCSGGHFVSVVREYRVLSFSCRRSTRPSSHRSRRVHRRRPFRRRRLPAHTARSRAPQAWPRRMDSIHCNVRSNSRPRGIYLCRSNRGNGSSSSSSRIGNRQCSRHLHRRRTCTSCQQTPTCLRSSRTRMARHHRLPTTPATMPHTRRIRHNLGTVNRHLPLRTSPLG